MNTLQGLAIGYALLGVCCAVIEITDGYGDQSKVYLAGAFLVTFLVWPVWIVVLCKDILDGRGR